jgi:anti-sigma B factor antagonist
VTNAVTNNLSGVCVARTATQKCTAVEEAVAQGRIRSLQLSIQHRQVGRVAVVTCRGQLVSGEEADALLKRIDDLLPLNSRILLDLGEIDFVDSGGLGLLVRCLTRVQNAAGQLAVCALSPKVSDVLRLTRLDSVLQPYASQSDAIVSAHHDTSSESTAKSSLILCADTSSDVLAYLRGVLKNAGHRVVTVENLPDALILLKAMRPSLVVIGAGLHAQRGTASADEFHRQLPSQRLIVLPSAFSFQDAGEGAGQLLGEIGTLLARV